MLTVEDKIFLVELLGTFCGMLLGMLWITIFVVWVVWEVVWFPWERLWEKRPGGGGLRMKGRLGADIRKKHEKCPGQ